MKQFLALLLSVAIALTGITDNLQAGHSGPPDAEIVARAVVESQTNGSDYRPQQGEDLAFYLTELYGIEEHTWMDAAVYAVGGVNAGEVVVLRPSSMNLYGEALAAALEEYRKTRAADFSGYIPDQEVMVENAVVVSGWGCVALLICKERDAAVAAFEATAGEAAAYRGDEAGLAPAETRWLLPFDPPNEFDMRLYDTQAVCRAYTSGDEGALNEKDAAILAKCREILAERVTEDMSDFEKEISLYDWLTAYGGEHMDETVYDPHTPLGQEDNTNPYGVLVLGYGICLGYAVTFQLLMELAQVECITVVGARKENRQDHAWNMVRLEGSGTVWIPHWTSRPGRCGGNMRILMSPAPICVPMTANGIIKMYPRPRPPAFYGMERVSLRRDCQ